MTKNIADINIHMKAQSIVEIKQYGHCKVQVLSFPTSNFFSSLYFLNYFCELTGIEVAFSFCIFFHHVYHGGLCSTVTTNNNDMAMVFDIVGHKKVKP